jgi:hypothetical protein
MTPSRCPLPKAISRPESPTNWGTGFKIRATARDAKPDPDKAAPKAGIVEILGDDEDAMVDAMEDCGR